MTETDDRLVFLDEAPPETAPEASLLPPPWQILIVDDDTDVHETTCFAMRDVAILGRPLQFLHAHSGAEALSVLRTHPDVAVLLLDVVMETPDAGLRIVEKIRDALKLTNLRIVLRTGQPGHAPELEAITRFDINDYKTKDELTRTKLFTTLTAAIRSFDQLRRLDASRLGLEKIISASNEFISKPGLRSFAEGVIIQIAGLIGVQPEGLVCASRPPADHPDGSDEDLRVIAAAGKYRHFIDSEIGAIPDPHIAEALHQSLDQHCSVVTAHTLTLFFEARDHHRYAAFIDSRAPIADIDRHLLEVFCTNIALCANNIELVAALRDQAFFDRLVGLPNRVAMLRELDQAIAQPDRAERALALVDVDQFSAINDVFGHRYGDQLLEAIAERLKADFPQCFLARVGSDVFGLLGRYDELAPAALQQVFAVPFNIDTVDHPLTTSIGVVRLSDVDGRGADSLQSAYIALKRAKSAGIAQSAQFSEALATEARARSRMLSDLRRALLCGEELFTVFQPQYCLRSGDVVGLEALVRWQRPDGSFIPPEQFIPIAEHSSLIVSLGEWVLRDSLTALAQLHGLGFAALRVAVNVSTVQLAQPNFLAIVNQALSDTGVAPRHLELEITESVAALGIDQVARLVEAIRDRGIAVALDDFGTGFSSLSYLDRLHVDRIKIDRSFVHTLDRATEARIAETVVPLGHRLGLTVLAEGIETDAQLAALRALDCDEIQGFLMAKPMRLDALRQWLQQPETGGLPPDGAA